MIELLIGLLSQDESPRPPIAIAVVSLDDATQGQIRYGRSQVSATRSEFGPFELNSSPVEETPFRVCLDYDLERASRCARPYVRNLNAQEGRPPVVVVLLADADTDEDRKPGQLEVACVGVGQTGTDPARQTIRLWPDAARLAGSRDLDIDREALVGCIRAAAAESGL